MNVRSFLADAGDLAFGGFGIQHERPEPPFLPGLNNSPIILRRPGVIATRIGEFHFHRHAEALVVGLVAQHADGIDETAVLGLLQRDRADLQIFQ